VSGAKSEPVLCQICSVAEPRSSLGTPWRRCHARPGHLQSPIPNIHGTSKLKRPGRSRKLRASSDAAGVLVGHPSFNGSCRAFSAHGLPGLEADRQADERIDPICRLRDTEVHAAVQLDILAQLIGQASSEDDDVTAWVLGVQPSRNFIVGAQLFAPFIGK